VIALDLLLATAVLAAQSPAADSIRVLAARSPPSTLVLETRARPLAVREAVTGALHQGELAEAGRLAAAYAVAWQDSFLVREVARFSGWPKERRAGKIWADSVRRAGITAYGRDGPAAAIAIWRRALARSLSIGDTAGAAAALGNIGAAFLEDGRADSAAFYLERARSLAHAIGELRVEANAVGSLGDLSADRGDLAAARERYTRSLSLRERIGDSRGVAATYNNLGLLAQSSGDLDEARRQYEAALALNRREGRDDVAATNLVNLAGIASLGGEFTRAEGLYRDALATWRAKEMWAEAAAALHGLGQLELRRGDYPAARAAFVEALTIYDRTGPLPDALAVRREMAGALAAMGEMQGALDELRHDQHLADSAGTAPGTRAGIALALATLAVQLNDLTDAERLYSRAGALYHQASDAEGEAEAQQGRALLLLDRAEYGQSRALLESALRAQTAAGNQRAAALARLSLGRVSLESGDTAAARRQTARAALDLARVGDPVGAAAALGERAALEAGAARPAVAESLYRAALKRVAGHPAPEVTWRLHAGLAIAFKGRGAEDSAAREFRAAIAELTRPSRSLTLAERRSGFLADKWEVYAQLALTERSRGLPGASFEASEQLRAREMLELLALGRVPAPSDTAADLVAREQDLRRHIAELTQGLDGKGASAGEALRGPPEVPPSGTTREALLRAQEAYSELLLEMRERAPRHAALISGATATWQDVARRLPSDQAFIEYLVSDSGSLAFVVTSDTLAVVDLGVGRRDLARLVRLARGAMEPQGSPRTDSLWRGPMRQLDRRLIAPLEEARLLAGKTRLVLVPHAELNYLPFAALVDSERPGRFLVERYEIAVTPSASVWLALGQRSRKPAAGGVLAFAPRPDALPASRQEVAAIARFAGAEVRTGSAASETAFRRDAPTRRVLHLATYGVLNKQNPLFSYVELAPAGADDGRLEVHEVFGLELAADLVVLSACQTGVGSGALADVPAGDDWVGLTRAFLHAGAGHVVASLWPVDDWATAALMEQFYQGYGRRADPVRALAQAQRALLAQPVTSHPFYWAGFVEVGGADGERAGR
jgi:CHAT domain-containing protein